MSAGASPATPRLRRAAGSADGPPVQVLLLHGMGPGVGSWDRLASSLSEYLELWDVNLPWSVTGDAGWAADSDVTGHVSGPVRDFQLAAGHGRQVVVAHSFAANVLLETLAGSDPPAAMPVVLISPFYPSAGNSLDLESVLPGMKDCYAKAVERIRLGRRSRTDTDHDAIAARILDLVGAHAPLRCYQTFQRTPLLRLESLIMPVLLVGGSEDTHARADGIRALADRIPWASVEIIDGCGHDPMTECAPVLADHIEKFVDQVVRTSPPNRHRRTRGHRRAT